MIRLAQVSKAFGQLKAVNEISLDINSGENLIFLGKSGCGKTTTLKMINRLIEPDSGSIFFDDVDVMDQQPENLRRNMGFVMQNIGLFPHYTVAENIAILPKILRWSRKEIDDRTHDLLSKLHLPIECLAKFPNALSGGQKQRVGLARALITNPPVLLMDEPFGALDNVTRTSIRSEFKHLDELKRKTIVMVTHDTQEAFELADRICLMDKGEVVQVGTPLELLYHPTNDFVRQFLDADRLVLAFKTITLSTLEHYFSDNGPSNGLVVNSSLTVWDALNNFKQGVAYLRFETTHQKQKTIDFKVLTAAFHHFQNQPNERN